ncbi:MAG: S-layer homology domain-containing protein [Acutalibacter sp.]
MMKRFVSLLLAAGLLTSCCLAANAEELLADSQDQSQSIFQEVDPEPQEDSTTVSTADTLPAESPKLTDSPDGNTPADGDPAAGEVPVSDEETSPSEDQESPTDQEGSEEDSEETPDEEEEPADPSVPLFPLAIDDHTAYVSGDTQDRVNPDKNLTRGEAASLVYNLLVSPAEPVSGRFQDVTDGQWFATAVNSLAAMGIVSGFDETTYQPSASIRRAEFVSILSKLFPMEEGEVTFTDVPDSHWGLAAIQNAVAKDWVSGYPDGTFRPNAPITRAEAFALINKMLGRSADKDLIDNAGKFFQFLDLPMTHWAYYHIMEASIPHTHTYDEEGNEVWGTYTRPTAKLGWGPHLIGGELYYVGNNGYYVRNAKVGVLQFDDMGRYTTGDASLDGKLTTITRQVADPSDSQLNNLRRMYDYVIDHYSYLASTYIDEGATNWENSIASTMIDRSRGNCYSYAALFTLLARKLGYQATAMSGMVTVDTCPTWTYGAWDRHGWVEILMGDGVTYVCDPQLEDGHAATWGYNWDMFMRPYGQGVAHYRVAGKVLS